MWRVFVVAGTFFLEATEVCNLFDHQHYCGHSRAGPGYHVPFLASGTLHFTFPSLNSLLFRDKRRIREKHKLI